MGRKGIAKDAKMRKEAWRWAAREIEQRASHGEGRKWWKGAGVREEEEDRRGTLARGTER